MSDTIPFGLGHFSVRIALALSGAALTHIALTPPTPPAQQSAVNKFGQPDVGTRIGRKYSVLMLPLYWILTVCEVTAILASHYPSTTSTRLLAILAPHSATSALNIRITHIVIVGWALTCLGSLLRLLCFRTLGRFFTFELSLQEGHKLVTWGPYAVVRHPSYTGTLMVASGNLLYAFGAGSWWKECGLAFTSVGELIALLRLISFPSFFVSVPVRIAKEDRIFRKEFGAEWDAWARKTPNKLIPFVY
ncbi:hypothetical protein POSPLADRAFT_1059428 [Postia placenta MAD-698-R-SB12]|uniref:Protein-S-isoprenylcysteine O-methyltransferase n=1 Tax=Postia placenta MAD-698-R-SB12 TaxID=670580 RepID=A0A1X6MSS6_9APHY|nr:hypothetical protein POSPLADRAFT_1059428 [Postia placenta MAD-698-R-SB12]OSX59223.1 hypothetical protein POSPLADRAFT_1059428 [Postia placenta MAD-698-R-SB12]